MGKQKYAFKDYNKESMARVLGKDISISTKHSVLICNALRNKPVKRAKALLENVIEKREAIPYTRYNKDTAHKPGKIGPGKYPMKACGEILALLKSAVSNAQFKGLNTDRLEVVHVCAHMASRPFHYGRQRRRLTKRTHIEIVLKEGLKKQESPDKKTEKKKKDNKEEKT